MLMLLTGVFVMEPAETGGTARPWSTHRLPGLLTRSHCRYLFPWRLSRWPDRPVSLVMKTHAHDLKPFEDESKSADPRFSRRCDWCNQSRSSKPHQLVCNWSVGTFLTVSLFSSIVSSKPFIPSSTALPDSGGALGNDSANNCNVWPDALLRSITEGLYVLSVAVGNEWDTNEEATDLA